MITKNHWILCVLAYLLHASSSQDIEPKELSDILRDIQISNSSEARASLSQKLCAIGYCDPKISEELAGKANQYQRQYQVGGNTQDFSELYGTNIDYSEFIGDKAPIGAPLQQSQQYIQQEVVTPSPSTHIHHHFHHNGNENGGLQKNDGIDYEGIRNAKNYAFQQQKLPIGVKKYPNNYNFERPQGFSNPNLNYNPQINKSPYGGFNVKKTQYIPNNIQNLQSLNVNDCTCVQYQYCATEDVVGRRDDLVLPLDPRNLNKDIEAEQNSTETVKDEAEHKVSKREVSNEGEQDLPDTEGVGVNFLSYFMWKL